MTTDQIFASAMLLTNVGWLALKQVAPLLGALLVARVTVHWALERFKSEKIWERQLLALADVVAAIRRMQRATLAVRDESAAYFGMPPPGLRGEAFVDYNAGMQNLRAAISVAAVLLPDEVQRRLLELQEFVDQPLKSDAKIGLFLEERSRALSRASDWLIQDRWEILKGRKRGG